jgi:hypothetical protein
MRYLDKKRDYIRNALGESKLTYSDNLKNSCLLFQSRRIFQPGIRGKGS